MVWGTFPRGLLAAFKCSLIRLRLIPTQSLLEGLRICPDHPVPDILNHTFHTVDDRLSRMSAESDGRIHSGCTAVTAFIRIEDAAGKQSFLFPEVESPASGLESHDSESGSGEDEDSGSGMIEESGKGKKSTTNGSRFKQALRSFGRRSPIPGRTTPRSRSPTVPTSQLHGNGITVFVPPTASRRVLYSANAGDARAVLCRAGKAIRLTYDHKGSDKQEAKRIMDAGGFVLGGRVNGVLAVTRSLGDSSMKDYVVGSPYTTETVLGEEDEFLILACDGVSSLV
jgi:protein phosphatase PTC1